MSAAWDRQLRIANVLVSDSWGELNPDAFNRGVGGREGAMMFLSREWAKFGHQVTNFVNVERGQRIPETPHYNTLKGFHEYLPLNLCRPMLANQPWDAVVAWENPSVFEDARIRENIGVKLCEMQVAHFQPKEMQAAEAYCDYVCALSDWHAEFLLHSGLDMPREKVVTLPNGVDISRYPAAAVEEKIANRGPAHFGNSPRFVYSSSPDRGLWQLLQSWRYIRREFPGASLEVGYGVSKLMSVLKWMHSRQAEMAVEIERLMAQSGVTDLGKIGQDELSIRQINADAWLYPLDSIQATETGCITAIENAAAGNPIITTDCDCMEAEFGPIGVINELPFDPQGFAESVQYVLRSEDTWKDLAQTGREFAETRDWGRIAPRWLTLFKNPPQA